MKISVITPTFGRAAFLPGLYTAFAQQTHPDCELLIADDSPEPSAFAIQLRDPRVKYFHSPQRQSIGEKRNLLIERAAGSVIAFFDDDDYYAPTYLQTMLHHLGDSDLITLSAWFTMAIAHDMLFYWDTRQIAPAHYRVGNAPINLVAFPKDDAFIAKNLNGYGFSYLFRKWVHSTVRFPLQNFGEDYAFVIGLLAAGHSVKYLEDTTGLALHILHANNTSTVFPQFQLPCFLKTILFPQLQAYLGCIMAV